MNSETSKLVSVVISSYNHEFYLSEAIQSVLSQTYPHFEIIVVDDGSADRSWEIATSFSSVRCIRQENAGTPAATRNRGLQVCSGDYVVFLDGDDRLLPSALEAGLRHLEVRPDHAFAAGRCQAMNHERKSLSTFPDRAEQDHFQALLRRNYILTPGSVIFRRAIMDELKGFDASPDKKGSDDFDLYLRIAARWPVYYHDDVVLEYREHAGNLSKNPERMLKSTINVLRTQRALVKHNRQYQLAFNTGLSFWREFYGEQVVEKIRVQVRSRDWRSAFRSIYVLLIYAPHLIVRHAFRKLYCVIDGR